MTTLTAVGATSRPPAAGASSEDTHLYALATPAAQLLPTAHEILAVHQPDPRGMCAGCLQHFGLLTPYPCSGVRWAAAVESRVPSRETVAFLGWPT